MTNRTAGLSPLSSLIYTHNPFYLLSAFLVLMGMHQALPAFHVVSGSWLLLGMLGSYILLLAVAGCVIVRYGQVWDDARTILLVLVLLFVALSGSFDRAALQDPATGGGFLALAFCLSVAVTEGVLGSLGIRLVAKYRLPYYLLLGLLFVYPWLLARMSVAGLDRRMSWGVLLFPAIAALVSLSLLPAARSRGSREPANGTPWPWPWYPWSLFVVLLVAIGLRTYSLSMAFDASRGTAASFEPYFLIPLFWSCALLLFEFGRANAVRPAVRLALLLPIGAMTLSLPGGGSNVVAARLLDRMIETVGSPAQWAVAGGCVFYAFAWARGARAAEACIVICLLLASIVGRHTVGLDTSTAPQVAPLAVLIGFELLLAIYHRSSLRLTTAAAMLLIGLRSWGWSSNYVVAHGAIVMLLLVGGISDARWARVFRHVAVRLLPVGALLVAFAYEHLFPGDGSGAHATYIAVLTGVSVWYWYRAPNMLGVWAILGSALALVIIASRSLYGTLETSALAHGLPWIVAGWLALVAGMLLSLIKAGIVQRLVRALHRLNALVSGDARQP